MTQQEVAINAMKKLNIFTPYIKEFKGNGTVTLFRRFIGYHIEEYNEPELLTAIREFEQKTGSLVYAVTEENTEFGFLYSFLCVPKYEEEWGREIESAGNYQIAWAYVYNKDCPDFSEFGSIGVQSAYGGIRRIY